MREAAGAKAQPERHEKPLPLPGKGRSFARFFEALFVVSAKGGQFFSLHGQIRGQHDLGLAVLVVNLAHELAAAPAGRQNIVFPTATTFMMRLSPAAIIAATAACFAQKPMPELVSMQSPS
jgi:hypothetical protein